MMSSNRSKSAIASDVIKFVADTCGIAPDRILLASRLREDLHLDGDDAHELLVSFCERFQIHPGGIDFSKFFGPEAGWSPIAFLLPKRQFLQMTIQDLIDSAAGKEWHIQATSDTRFSSKDTEEGIDGRR